jgi:uncharacterized protein with GYD domain
MDVEDSSMKPITENTLFYGDNLIILREHILMKALILLTLTHPLIQAATITYCSKMNMVQIAKRGKKDGKRVMTCLCITLGVTFFPQLLVASLSVPCVLKNARVKAIIIMNHFSFCNGINNVRS